MSLFSNGCPYREFTTANIYPTTYLVSRTTGPSTEGRNPFQMNLRLQRRAVMYGGEQVNRC